MKAEFLTVFLVVVLLLAGCGGNKDSDTITGPNEVDSRDPSAEKRVPFYPSEGMTVKFTSDNGNSSCIYFTKNEWCKYWNNHTETWDRCFYEVGMYGVITIRTGYFDGDDPILEVRMESTSKKKTGTFQYVAYRNRRGTFEIIGRFDVPEVCREEGER